MRVEVPVFLRDVAGTPLGAGTPHAIQGFAFRVDFPAAQITGAGFVQAGVTAGKTAICPIVQAHPDHLVVLLSFDPASAPLVFPVGTSP